MGNEILLPLSVAEGMGSEMLLPLSIAGGFAISAALFAFVYFRGVTLTHFYQQEHCNTERFFVWMIKRRAFDKKATLIILLSYIGWFLALKFIPNFNQAIFNPVFYILVFIALVLGAISSYNARKSANQPAMLDGRGQRILFVYMVLTAAYFSSVFSSQMEINITLLTFSFLGFFQAPPFLVAISNFVLRPMEESMNRRLVKRAKNKLGKFSPTVIGVAGSYGKTSTKHILAHILSARAPVLATPDNGDSLLDVAGVISEGLKDHHKYLIVEMGGEAGVIKKVSGLMQPNLAIITSVGYAKFKQVKTLERAFRNQFELANQTQGRGEKTIVNTEAIPEDLLRSYMMSNSGIILCGKEKSSFDLDVALVSCSQGESGLNIKLSFRGQKKGEKETIDFVAPLYGPHNGYNVMLAVAAGLELGLELEAIKKILKTLRPISHRLEVIQGVKGPTIIDDTYYANPDGFESALSVLSDLQKPGGRRILVTPGILDLGSQHDAQHKKLGQIAGKHVDIALVVGARRMKTFSAAFNSTKEKGAQLRTFEIQKDAEDWIKQNADNKDTILFEGHLPALYETFIEF